MTNSGVELNQLGYHSKIDSDLAHAQQADELAIANMISALNNPTIAQTMNAEELKTVIQAIRNHVTEKAKLIVDIQQDRQEENSRRR